MRFKSLIKFIFVCVWVATFFEAYIRVFKVQPIIPRNITEGEYGIRVNKASVKYTHKTKDYKVDFQTNSKGMRANYEIEYVKPEEVFRLMLLGDSFGMGYGATIEQSFIQRTADILSANMDKKVEVINLSVSGYSTAEQVIALQQEGVKYSPDLIVSTWHHTDLDENRWSNLFSIENGQLKRKADSYLPGVRERAILESIPLYSFLSEQSQGYSFVREKAALIIKSIMRNKKSTTVDSPPNAEKSDLAVALYTKLANVARQSNAPLVVLNIPKKTSSQIYENTMPSGIRENFFVAEPIRLFKENRASLLYWEHSQGHFTPLGNDLVAQTLALKIMDMTQSKNNNR